MIITLARAITLAIVIMFHGDDDQPRWWSCAFPVVTVSILMAICRMAHKRIVIS